MGRRAFLRREITETLMLAIMNATGKTPDTLAEIFQRYGTSYPIVSKAFKATFGTTPAKFRDRFKSDTHYFSHVYEAASRVGFTSDADERMLFNESSRWRLFGDQDVPLIYSVNQVTITIDGAEEAFQCDETLIEGQWTEFRSENGKYIVAMRPSRNGKNTRLSAFICRGHVGMGKVDYRYQLEIDMTVELLAKVEKMRLHPRERAQAARRYIMVPAIKQALPDVSERSIYTLAVGDKTVVLGLDQELIPEEIAELKAEWKRQALNNDTRRMLRRGLELGTHQFPDFTRALLCQDSWVTLAASKKGKPVCLAKSVSTTYAVELTEADDPTDLMYLNDLDTSNVVFITDEAFSKMLNDKGYERVDLTTLAHRVRTQQLR